MWELWTLDKILTVGLDRTVCGCWLWDVAVGSWLLAVAVAVAADCWLQLLAVAVAHIAKERIWQATKRPLLLSTGGWIQ